VQEEVPSKLLLPLVSVRTVAAIIAGYEMHHVAILRKRLSRWGGCLRPA
jgi:hypothetical protein